MRRIEWMAVGIFVLGLLLGPGMAYGQDERAQILKVRESVWRAWFANDTNALQKLVPLEFPRTEIQRFGDVAIIWTSYVVETEENGKSEVRSGRATEIFVRRNGEGVNPGWHTDNFRPQ